jgi:predicted MFS family arabinose efflux permease
LLCRPSLAIVPVLVAIAVWGVAAWSFYPAQQARLIGITGPPLAPVVRSLNASAMYLGFSIGAALGSFTLVRTSPVELGWVGGAVELAALVLFWFVRRPASAGAPARSPSTLRPGRQ